MPKLEKPKKVPRFTHAGWVSYQKRATGCCYHGLKKQYAEIVVRPRSLLRLYKTDKSRAWRKERPHTTLELSFLTKVEAVPARGGRVEMHLHCRGGTEHVLVLEAADAADWEAAAKGVGRIGVVEALSGRDGSDDLEKGGGGNNSSLMVNLKGVLRQPSASLSAVERDALDAAFGVLVADADGNITRRELDVLLKLILAHDGDSPSSREDAAFAVEVLKTAENGAGLISRDAFASAFLDHASRLSAAGVGSGEVKDAATAMGNVLALLTRAKAAFANADEDGDGALDADEIRLVMGRMGEQITVLEAQALVNALDENGDGVISCNEFVCALADDHFAATAVKSLPKMKKAAAMAALGRLRKMRELQTVPIPSFFDHSRHVTESETMRALKEMNAVENACLTYFERANGSTFVRVKEGEGVVLGALANTPAEDEADPGVPSMPAMPGTPGTPGTPGGKRLNKSHRGSSMQSVTQISSVDSKSRLQEAASTWGDNVFSAGAHAVFRRVRSKALLLGALAGFLSGLIVGAGTMSATAIFMPSAAGESALNNTAGAVTALWMQNRVQHTYLGSKIFNASQAAAVVTPGDDPAGYWTFIMCVSFLATAVELGTLYTTSLRAVVAVTQITKVKLFPMDNDRSYVATSIVRVAMEMGHSSSVQFGVDPLGEQSQKWLALKSIVYAAKRGACTFLLRWFIKKVLVKKVGTRLAAKALLAFAAIPVNMFWNVLTIRRVIDDSLVIAVGPAAAQKVLFNIMRTGDTDVKEGEAITCDLSPIARIQVLRAIAAVVVKKKHLHPNHHVLMHMARHMAIIDWPATAEGATHELAVLQGVMAEFDGVGAFLNALPLLSDDERERVATVAICSIVLDGRLTSSDRKMYRQLIRTCGFVYAWRDINRMLIRMSKGKHFSAREVLKSLRRQEGDFPAPYTSEERYDAIKKFFLDKMAI